MSLLGHCLLHGSLVEVYRARETGTGDGGVKIEGWLQLETNVPCIIETVSDQAMQKAFGTPAVIRDRAMVPGQHDWKPLDLVVVTGGKRVGQVWRVSDPRMKDHGAIDAHLDVALESTTEDAPDEYTTIGAV